MTRRVITALVLVATGLLGACSSGGETGEDANVTKKGTVEVTAQLLEIRGELPSNDLYDYSFVMKYKVLEAHRGALKKG
ncbi:MAG: hypothetical protein ACE15E_03340 [Acidobacteriota bacterium]